MCSLVVNAIVAFVDDDFLAQEQGLDNEVPTEDLSRDHALSVGLYDLFPGVLGFRYHEAKFEIQLLDLLPV